MKVRAALRSPLLLRPPPFPSSPYIRCAAVTILTSWPRLAFFFPRPSPLPWLLVQPSFSRVPSTLPFVVLTIFGAVVIIQGDYWRYLAEVHTDAEREKDSSECQTAYSDGLTVAQETLASTHSLRLGIALNYSGDPHNKSPHLLSGLHHRVVSITSPQFLSSRANYWSFWGGRGQRGQREGGGSSGLSGFVMRIGCACVYSMPTRGTTCVLDLGTGADDVVALYLDAQCT
jgi:hypothetical protein